MTEGERKLNQLAEEFNHWRETRPNKEPIPDALWKKVAQLDSEKLMTRSLIIKTLKLEYQKAKKMCEKFSQVSSLSVQSLPNPVPAAFVEATIEPELPSLSESIVLELSRPDGAQLRLRYHDINLQPGPLIKTFLES